MKAMFCSLALGALVVLAAAAPPAGAGTASCAAPNTPVSKAVKGAHGKASSFAPQGHPGPKVYGQPIQPPLLHHRKPHKSALPAT
jgi:hypothetical protein